MKLKDEILRVLRSVINPIGYDVVKYSTSNPSYIIHNLLRMNNIDVILDVGANIGQYAHELRKAGYKGQLISFEPLSEAFAQLNGLALKDQNWKTYNYALGEADSTSVIHISRHSPSSSILPMSEIHREAAPGSEYLKEEKIEIYALDSIYSGLNLGEASVFLKIDTQGYEKKVLEGAAISLNKIKGIQLELSATQLYEGEDSYYSICRYLEERNFHLARIIPGFTHPVTREMLQFDALFFKKV